MAKATAVKLVTKVPNTVGSAVDLYLDLHAKKAELESQLESLRGVIEPHMKEYGLDEIVRDGGRVHYVKANYISYDAKIVADLDPSNYTEVMVPTIDKDRFEALHTLGLVESHVIEASKLIAVKLSFRAQRYK